MNQHNQLIERVIREAECRQLTGICRTTRYMMEKDGQFPARRKLGGGVPLAGFFLKFLSGRKAAAKQLKGEVWHKTQRRPCRVASVVPKTKNRFSIPGATLVVKA